MAARFRSPHKRVSGDFLPKLMQKKGTRRSFSFVSFDSDLLDESTEAVTHSLSPRSSIDRPWGPCLSRTAALDLGGNLVTSDQALSRWLGGSDQQQSIKAAYAGIDWSVLAFHETSHLVNGVKEGTVCAGR